MSRFKIFKCFFVHISVENKRISLEKITLFLLSPLIMH